MSANPDTLALIGGFVQGQSRLKATVVASGAHGSSIEASTVSMDGATVPSGQTLPLPQAGVRSVAAAVTDSRGRTGITSGNVTVLPYSDPQIREFTVDRATAAGVVNESGTHLLVTLDAAVSSLIVGTQKNALTVSLFTRARGTTAWTPRNVITSGIAYDSSVLISGGGIFSASSAWEVQVRVADKLLTGIDYYVVPTAGAILDATATQLAVGKRVEASGPPLQLQGPARVHDGDFSVDGDLRHRGTSLVEPVGIITAFAGATAPTGWLLCDGAAVSRATYADLFAVLGTTYGAGNGSTTFNVPNFKGRTPVGLDAAQPEFNVRGGTGGAKTHTLTIAEIPSHSHGLGGILNAGTGTARRTLTSYPGGNDANTESVGGGNAHNNLQPYVTVPFIIKAL